MEREFIRQRPIPQFELQNPQSEHNLNSKYLGFSGRVFPLIGFIVSFFSIIWCYHVARKHDHVKPFPQSDITDCGRRFPEYIVFRVGLLVAGPLFCLSFQVLKNFLEIKSFEILGTASDSLNSFGPISIASCIFLGISTSTISDGPGDMNFTLHTIGATGFFILGLLLALKASKIYRKLWSVRNNFVPKWSYQIKKYSNFILASIILLELADLLNLLKLYAFVEWYATFYLLFFFLTLFWDLKGMEIVLFRA